MAFQNAVLKVKEKISLPMLILIAVGILNFYYLLSFSVNVPHREEWNGLLLLNGDQSVFKAHLSGRPVFSNILTYLFYWISGWNIRANLVFNYVIYLADVVLLYCLIVKAAGKYKYLPLFFLPLFSDMNALNFTQTTASQFYLTVLFGLLAADFGFCRPETYRNTLLFLLFLFLSVFSMNFVFALGVLLGYAIVQLRQKSFRRVLGVAVMFLGMLRVFQGDGIALSFLADKNKLHSFVTLYSAVLTGIDMVTPLHYFLILPVIGGLGYVFYQRKALASRALMLLFSIVFASVFCAVAAERNADSYVFIHRGAGIVLFAFPVVLTLLRLVRPVFIYVCCVAVIGYSASFSVGYFHVEARGRKNTLECAQSYYAGQNNGSCADVDQASFYFDLAKKLNLSFTRR